MLTIFSAPKAFDDPKIATIQHNAIHSWTQLGREVEVLLIGDDSGVAAVADDLGLRHLPAVEKNYQGTPLIHAIFEIAAEQASHGVLAYVNADILLLSDFMPAVKQCSARFDNYMIVGQRWDMDLGRQLNFGPSWEKRLRQQLRSEARLHPPAGSDYFVFPKGQFGKLPPFALGRAGWDNWMIYNARHLGIPVVDATRSITAVHQDHDYGHLAGGVPHYRLPESRENVEMGGGTYTVFTLSDATWKINGRGLAKISISQVGLRRAIEADFIARVGAGPNLKFVRALFHPISAIRSLMARIFQPAADKAKPE